MKLETLASAGQTVARHLIGGDVELATQIQNKLALLGLLDPPADGNFGPASHWALSQFIALKKLPATSALDAALASSLLGTRADNFLPLKPGNDFAGRIVSAALKANYWLCRHPDCVNILYVEGIDTGGKVNDDAPNVFNDVRVIIRIGRTGKPRIDGIWEATTEPGFFYTKVRKLDPKGAARIAFGQYKSWSVGTHMLGRKSAHEALVQVANIKVFRDLNEDFERPGDEPFVGVFAINQHCGFDMPRGDIGHASAGCLVGRTKAGHVEFMKLCKSDLRYQANNGYRFMTGVLPASALA